MAAMPRALTTSRTKSSSISSRQTKSPRSSSSRSKAKAATSSRRRRFTSACARSRRKHGMLLMVDEVQSGMGRTGKMFAIEHFGVEPDVVAVAKGIASGLPLGVTTSRAEIMAWPPGAHASTFGGNPVSCAAALATITLLKD